MGRVAQAHNYVEPRLVSLWTETSSERVRGLPVHRHRMTFNEHGNGHSDNVDNHVHLIHHLTIQPAGMPLHTHDISSERCTPVEED